MSFFLFKPHVEGPKGDITTPDILLDRLFVAHEGKVSSVPVDRVTCESELQIDDDVTAVPGFFLVASGAGPIVGPAVQLNSGNGVHSITDIQLARKAWRHANLTEHFEEIELASSVGKKQLGAFSDMEAVIPQVPGVVAEQLPRGIAVLAFAYELVTDLDAPARFAMTLQDDVKSRKLDHYAQLVPISVDPWHDRPTPRYSVGPQTGEVTHYV